MRSKATNVLQIIILLTGIIYIIIGLFYYIAPLALIKLFAQNVSENWLDLVRDHDLVAPMYYMSRGFAALLGVTGLSMVMPLFDPLKYRELIYFNGLFFPFLAALLFIKNGVIDVVISTQSITGQQMQEVSQQSDVSSFFANVHMILFISAIIFTLIFLLTLIGLIITKKQSASGVE